ncbi:hypothetical protein DY000_02034731 [Brassica cretica]|uniref:DUF4005 domain-containing protein n=1 Tax=Brassica cretica TaxID=69181 RepID=A0ABQ7DIJ3_BRACR|nr:hypothetical protein DY000_02034731 [Brassica cretica]
MRISKVELLTAEQTKRTHEREEEEEPSFFSEAGGTKLASPVSQAGFAPCELPSYQWLGCNSFACEEAWLVLLTRTFYSFDHRPLLTNGYGTRASLFEESLERPRIFKRTKDDLFEKEESVFFEDRGSSPTKPTTPYSSPEIRQSKSAQEVGGVEVQRNSTERRGVPRLRVQEIQHDCIKPVAIRVKLAHCQKTNRSSYLDQRTLIPGALATRLKRRGISYSSTCLERNESISKRRGRKHDSGAEPYDARV